jgi:hypothetical protein
MKHLILGIALFSFSPFLIAGSFTDTNMSAPDTVVIPANQIWNILCLHPLSYYNGLPERDAPRVTNTEGEYRDFYTGKCPDTLNIDFTTQTMLYFPTTFWGCGWKIARTVTIVGDTYIYNVNVVHPSGPQCDLICHQLNVIIIPKIRDSCKVNFVFTESYMGGK